MIVMPDADLDKTVDALVGAAYGSAGERCMAISVAVLVGDVGDQIVPKLAERCRELNVTQGMDLTAEMGPIVTAAAKARIEATSPPEPTKAPIWWSMDVVSAWMAMKTGSGWAVHCLTTSNPA